MNSFRLRGLEPSLVPHHGLKGNVGVGALVESQLGPDWVPMSPHPVLQSSVRHFIHRVCLLAEVFSSKA